MKSRGLIVSMIFSLLLTGCSSSRKSMINVFEQFPATDSAIVTIYGIHDSVPRNYIPLALIAQIGDNNPYLCHKDDILGHIKKKTAEIGGTAFAIYEEKEAGAFNDCYQVKGHVLLTGDYVNPNRLDYNNFKKQLAARKLPSNTLYGNIGIGGITSRVEMVEGMSGNPKIGLEWEVGYSYVGSKGMGVSLMYNNYSSSYNYYESSTGLNHKINLYLDYVGVGFTQRIKLSSKWIIGYEIGLGYFGYREKMRNNKYHQAGIGTHLAVEFEYKISKTVGIGGKTCNITGRMGQNQGFDRINLMIGPRIYF